MIELRQKTDTKTDAEAVFISYTELINYLINDSIKEARYISNDLIDLIRTHTRITVLIESFSELECMVLESLVKNALNKNFLKIVGLAQQFESNQKQFFIVSPDEYKTVYKQKILLNPDKKVFDKMIEVILNKGSVSSEKWLMAIRNLIDNQIEIEKALIDEITIKTKQKANDTTNKFYFMCLSIVVYGFAIIWVPIYLSKRMNLSIKHIYDGINRFLSFIKGESEDYKTITVFTKDEIGKIAEACNKSFEEIKKLKKDLEEQIKLSECGFDMLSQYQNAVESVYGIVIINSKGIITWVNDRLCEKTGYSKKELIGQPHTILCHPDIPMSVFEEIYGIVKSKQIWHGILKNRRKDGTAYYVKTVIFPFLDFKNNITRYVSIREDITELQTAREKIEAILNAQESIVAIGKPVEGVTYLNKKFFEIFPYNDLNDFLSKHKYFSELFIEKEGYLKKSIPGHHWTEQVLKEPEKLHFAIMKDKYGNERIFSVNVKKVELETESFLIKIFTDVTEIEIARQKAVELEKAKSDFLSRMSHEIRTPLTGIVGFFDLLSKTRLDDVQRRYISIIQSSIETLINIINDILDISKIEAGKMKIEYSDVNPFVEFDKILTLFAPKARQKGLKYYYSIDPKLNECLTVAINSLKQVLSNLISNAVKFTETGEIKIEIKVIQDLPESQTVKFEVRDTGIGIPEDKQAIIFEKFEQVESSITKGYGGTGLGLTIASALVKMMGGEIRLESEFGKGSSFYFTLSFKKCSPDVSLKKTFDTIRLCLVKTPDGRSENVASMLALWHIPYYHLHLSELERHYDIGIFFNKKDLEKCLEKCNRLIFVSDKELIEHEKVITVRETSSQIYIAIIQSVNNLTPEREKGIDIKIPLKVLVAEDNEINRMFIEELLKRYGIQKDFALNGAEAIKMINEKKYDIVFLDISMPVMNGMQAIEIIKKDYPELPVVALTAHVFKEEKERLFEAGFDEYLPKPISIVELERILKKYAKIIYVEKEPSFITRAKEEMAIPETTIKNLFEKFFSTLPVKIEEISKAVADSDSEKLFLLSQSLKGSAGQLKLESLASISKSLEESARNKETHRYSELFENLKKEATQLLEEYHNWKRNQLPI